MLGIALIPRSWGQALLLRLHCTRWCKSQEWMMGLLQNEKFFQNDRWGFFQRIRVLWSSFTKSAFNDFHGFGSNFCWIWVYILGVKCMCFRKHKYSQPFLLKKRKVLSKIRRLQKVLSNMASLQGCFLKNEGFFQIYEAYRRSHCCQLTVSKE